MKSIKITAILFFICTSAFTQTTLSVKSINGLADSLYRTKDYPEATAYYLQVANLADFKLQKANAYYNAACCLALQNKVDSAFTFLNTAIQLGYNNKQNLIADKDLVSLHSKEKQWKHVVSSIRENKVLNSDPEQAKFITDDVHRFWNAYDRAYTDTAHFNTIFKEHYFDKASRGMNDYMGLKVSSIDFFTSHIKSAPKFYQSIRKNTLDIDNYKKDFLASFKKFKELYPPARFPDVYFVIGAFTSGGTVSNAGLLIGVNQAAETDSTSIDELSVRLRTRMNKMKHLSNLIAHELIHFQQDNIKRDTITLGYAIQEGMADFLGELISGNTANVTLFEWAKGKEKNIWEKFTKDMYFNRYNNWIANSQRSTPDNLPDQGYWVGYQICKAYYEKAKDKKQAIWDMLHIKDYQAFLRESGWEEIVSKMN